jgi:hypothetical protein
MGGACTTCLGVGFVGDRTGGTMVEGRLVDVEFTPTAGCPTCNPDGDVASYRSPTREAPKSTAMYVDSDKPINPNEPGVPREAIFSAGEIARQDAADLSRMAREE